MRFFGTADNVHVLVLQTLGSDWRMYTKKGSNTDGMFKPLGQIKWHRVVLDVSSCALSVLNDCCHAWLITISGFPSGFLAHHLSGLNAAGEPHSEGWWRTAGTGMLCAEGRPQVVLLWHTNLHRRQVS